MKAGIVPHLAPYMIYSRTHYPLLLVATHWITIALSWVSAMDWFASNIIIIIAIY